mmetsp:Transcript_5657/g.22246  ORF Transcript_5657/g.22246 Transcript_5657/m.22246 type:complete len:593 (+) Transcript_5657:218-1996(+)
MRELSRQRRQVVIALDSIANDEEGVEHAAIRAGVLIFAVQVRAIERGEPNVAVLIELLLHKRCADRVFRVRCAACADEYAHWCAAGMGIRRHAVNESTKRRAPFVRGDIERGRSSPRARALVGMIVSPKHRVDIVLDQQRPDVRLDLSHYAQVTRVFHPWFRLAIFGTVGAVDQTRSVSAKHDPRRLCAIDARKFALEPLALRRSGRKVDFGIHRHDANRSESHREPIGVWAGARRRVQARRRHRAFAAAVVDTVLVRNARLWPIRAVSFVVAEIGDERHARRPRRDLCRPFVPNAGVSRGVGQVAEEKHGVDGIIARVALQGGADVERRLTVRAPRFGVVVRSTPHIREQRERCLRIFAFCRRHAHRELIALAVSVAREVLDRVAWARYDGRGVHVPRMSVSKTVRRRPAQIARVVRRRRRRNVRVRAVTHAIRQSRAVTGVSSALPRHASRRAAFGRRSPPTRRERHPRPHRRQCVLDVNRRAPRHLHHSRRVRRVCEQYEVVRRRAMRQRLKHHARRPRRRVTIHAPQHRVFYRRRLRRVRARRRVRSDPMLRERRVRRRRRRNRRANASARPRRRRVRRQRESEIGRR